MSKAAFWRGCADHDDPSAKDAPNPYAPGSQDFADYARGRRAGNRPVPRTSERGERSARAAMNSRASRGVYGVKSTDRGWSEALRDAGRIDQDDSDCEVTS